MAALPEFDEREKQVLRYLANKCVDVGGDNDGTVMPDEIQDDNDLTPEERKGIIANFKALGYLETLASDGTLVINDIVCSVSSKLSSGRESTMDVLISWSKAQSQEIASVFHGWIPKVLPGVNPWMSNWDVGKGKEWFSELHGLLAGAKLCIICVTRENVRSPWLYYEAGAIAGKGENVRVCPYLIDVDVRMLSDGPLGKFQCMTATKNDTLSLISSLNKVLDDTRRHNEQILAGNFETQWPGFEAELSRVLAMDVNAEDGFVATDADDLADCNLSSEARAILAEACLDKHGIVIHTDLRAGLTVRTNERNLVERCDARTGARWKQAIKDLVACDLMEPLGPEGQTFKLTDKGYKVADLIRETPGEP